MRALVHRTWWDLIVGVLTLGSLVLVGGVIGGLVYLWGFLIYALFAVVTGPTDVDYWGGVGLWVWGVSGVLAAAGYLGHNVRADRDRTQVPPIPTPGG